MTGKIVLFHLLALVLVGANGEEECRFNEYTSTKVVSEWAAVLISVENLVDCLGYLKNNKLTHKVVAFDESTKRCCSVLDTLDYNLVSEKGWTTFEIRVMESNSSSTHKPDTTTGAPSSPTTNPNIYLQNITKGICKESETWLPNGEATLSVYSYEFDLWQNASLSYPYENYMDCYHVITTYNTFSFQFSVLYDQEEIYDYLEVRDQYQSMRFSGKGFFSGYMRGNAVYLIWRTDSKNVGNGFTLKIFASNIQWSVPLYLSLESTNYPTVTNATNSSITGICENDRTVLQPAESATLSVYSYSTDACYDLNALRNYTFNMSCTHNVFSTEFGGFKVTVYYLLETNNDYLEISDDVSRLRLSGSGMASTSFDGAALRLLWKSDRSVNSKGFCFQVTALNSTAKATMGETAESFDVSRRGKIEEADRTIGMCESETTWLSVGETATVAAVPYDGDACFDMNKLSSSTKKMTCYHEIKSAVNTGFSVSVYYKTSINASAIAISDGKEMLQFSGQGEYHYSTTGTIVKLQWRTDATDEPTSFCVRLTAI